MWSCVCGTVGPHPCANTYGGQSGCLFPSLYLVLWGRVPSYDLGATDSARLAGHPTPGPHLSQFPRLWDCKQVPPCLCFHRCFELNSVPTLTGKHFTDQAISPGTLTFRTDSGLSHPFLVPRPVTRSPCPCCTPPQYCSSLSFSYYEPYSALPPGHSLMTVPLLTIQRVPGLWSFSLYLW